MYSVVWGGVRWVRDLVCVMEAGVEGAWGKCCYVYTRIVIGRLWYPIMCVCGAFMYTIYVSFMYVLGCNIQGYGNFSFFFSRTLTRN